MLLVSLQPLQDCRSVPLFLNDSNVCCYPFKLCILQPVKPRTEHAHLSLVTFFSSCWRASSSAFQHAICSFKDAIFFRIASELGTVLLLQATPIATQYSLIISSFTMASSPFKPGEELVEGSYQQQNYSYCNVHQERSLNWVVVERVQNHKK